MKNRCCVTNNTHCSTHLSGARPCKAWLLPMARLWQPATSLKKKAGKKALTKALQYMLGFHGKMEAKEHRKKKKRERRRPIKAMIQKH